MKTNISLCILVWVAGMAFSFSPQLAVGQKITYSEPEREDNRRTNFEIIGKVGGNMLIFKNNRNENDISVYDNDMKLLNRVKQTDMSDRWINVDFVAYPEFAWMIYQFQRKSIVYCMAVKIDGNGKRVSEPVELDTTRIGWAASNKIYTTIDSDDKQKIMVFKINSKNQRNFVFTTLLYNSALELQARHRMNLAMEERNDYFTDFLLDNEGDLVFGKFIRRSGSDNVSDVSLVIKKAQSESFILKDINTASRVLDDVKLKVDNASRRYLINAFYYKQRRGNVEGLYSAIWDQDADSLLRQTEMPFNDELRRIAKSPDANLRLAFNDYFITSAITKKDGGYILISESVYNTTRGGAFNRWDYINWYNPWVSPIDAYYWSPYSSTYSPWGSPYYNRWGSQATRYHAENIMVLSFDKEGQLEWSNVIPKSQFDDETDALISHQVMITGGELHFLFNLYEKRALLLNDNSIGPDGNVTRYPTLRNLDRQIDFMPRYGKQISSRTIILPCFLRNYLTFAKIEF